MQLVAKIDASNAHELRQNRLAEVSAQPKVKRAVIVSSLFE